MVKDLDQLVTFGKGPGGKSVLKDAEGHAPMWKNKSILGPTLLERPRGPLFNQRDARDEESLREPARLLGCVWEDKRYTRSTKGSSTYERPRWPASRMVSRS